MIVTKLIVVTHSVKCYQEDYAAPYIMKRHCPLRMLVLENNFKFIKINLSRVFSIFSLCFIHSFIHSFFFVCAVTSQDWTIYL